MWTNTPEGIASFLVIPCWIKFSIPDQVKKKNKLTIFKHYDFTNDEDWEAQILGSVSNWSQLQDLMVKSSRKWLKKNYKCVSQKEVVLTIFHWNTLGPLEVNSLCRHILLISKNGKGSL
jgi:hypothetical protein